MSKLVESDHCSIEFSLKAQPFCNTNESMKAYDHVSIKLLINVFGMYR